MRSLTRSLLARMAIIALGSAWVLAAPSLALAETSGPTTISGTIAWTHDRLPPDEVRNIITEAHFTFRLLGKNNVQESITYVVVGAEGHAANLSGPDFNGNAKLGESGSKITWRVLGARSLQRLSEGRQYVFVMNFEIDEAKHCALSANFVLQKGFSSIVSRRFDNGQLHNFSLQRVVSTACSIE